MYSVFENPPVLENERALLKPLAEEDFEALCVAGADASVWQYSTVTVQTREDLINYLQTALNQRLVRQALPFTIIDKTNLQVAGCTRFGNFSWENRRVEIGWTWIGVHFQKTGLNRACKHLLLDYAFTELGMNRVELKADARNAGSREAMRKMGATEEGILRQHMIMENGYIRDTVYFSVLAQEWETLKRSTFAAFSANT
jgi:N-acetyltransferase